MEEKPISDVPLRTQLSTTAQKQTNDFLWDLVGDGVFLAQLIEIAFQKFLHEDIWTY
jgi:hypothetical protein